MTHDPDAPLLDHDPAVPTQAALARLCRELVDARLEPDDQAALTACSRTPAGKTIDSLRSASGDWIRASIRTGRKRLPATPPPQAEGPRGYWVIRGGPFDGRALHDALDEVRAMRHFTPEAGPFRRDDPRLPRGETESFGAYVHRLAVHDGHIGPGHPLHGLIPEAFGPGPEGLAATVARTMPAAGPSREPGEEG